MLTILTQQNSIANHFLAELRNIEVQQDRMRFRRNLERLGEIFPSEISKTFTYEPAEVETPLGIAEKTSLIEQPVLATIRRSGVAMQQGMLTIFNQVKKTFKREYPKQKKNNP